MMNEASPPIDSCPKCDYPFTGLPAANACPECGLTYDERSCVCRSSATIKTHPASSGLWLANLGLLVVTPFVRRDIAFAILWLTIALNTAGFYFARRMKRGRNLAVPRKPRGHVAAATIDGLFLRVGPLTPAFTPWSEVNRAECTHIFGWHMVKVRVWAPRGAIGVGGVFKTKAEQFAAAVNAYADEADNVELTLIDTPAPEGALGLPFPSRKKS